MSKITLKNITASKEYFAVSFSLVDETETVYTGPFKTEEEAFNFAAKRVADYRADYEDWVDLEQGLAALKEEYKESGKIEYYNDKGFQIYLEDVIRYDDEDGNPQVRILWNDFQPVEK